MSGFELCSGGNGFGNGEIGGFGNGEIGGFGNGDGFGAAVKFELRLLGPPPGRVRAAASSNIRDGGHVSAMRTVFREAGDGAGNGAVTAAVAGGGGEERPAVVAAFERALTNAARDSNFDGVTHQVSV